MNIKGVILGVLFKEPLKLSIGQKLILGGGKRGEVLGVNGSFLSIGRIDKKGLKVCQRTGHKLIQQKTLGISKESFLQLVTLGEISYE